MASEILGQIYFNTSCAALFLITHQSMALANSSSSGVAVVSPIGSWRERAGD